MGVSFGSFGNIYFLGWHLLYVMPCSRIERKSPAWCDHTGLFDGFYLLGGGDAIE